MNNTVTSGSNYTAENSSPEYNRPEQESKSQQYTTLVLTGSLVGTCFLAAGAYLGYVFNLRRIELLDDKWSGRESARTQTSSKSLTSSQASRSWRTLLPGPGATRTPAALALKAFGYGTLLSLATFGVATWSITAYLHSFGPRPPAESYFLTEKDGKGLSGEDRAAVLDFGLWMDAREVDEKLRLEREASSEATEISPNKQTSIKDARASALAAALSKAAANASTLK